MTDELMQNVLSAVQSCDVERLPRILGMLAEISAVAQSRLSAPVPVQQPDELLTVTQAAAKLNCSTATLYKKDFSFMRRLGRKRLFSNRAIDEYLTRQK